MKGSAADAAQAGEGAAAAAAVAEARSSGDRAPTSITSIAQQRTSQYHAAKCSTHSATTCIGNTWSAAEARGATPRCCPDDYADGGTKRDPSAVPPAAATSAEQGEGAVTCGEGAATVSVATDAARTCGEGAAAAAACETGRRRPGRGTRGKACKADNSPAISSRLCKRRLRCSRRSRVWGPPVRTLHVLCTAAAKRPRLPPLRQAEAGKELCSDAAVRLPSGKCKVEDSNALLSSLFGMIRPVHESNPQ